MDNAIDSSSLQNSKESLTVEDELKPIILAADQEYAKKIEQVSSQPRSKPNTKGLPLIIINKVEKVIAERDKLEGKRKEIERWLEVAQLIGAQQRLANLDMQIKLNVMWMGNLQLVSGHDFILFYASTFFK